MADQIIMTFVADTDVKAMLEGWAKEDDRSVSYVIRKAIETEKNRRTKQLPLAVEETADEPTDQTLRRLKVQELPGFIFNDVVKVKKSASSPALLPLGEGSEVFHLGTGPGDETGK